MDDTSKCMIQIPNIIIINVNMESTVLPIWSYFNFHRDIPTKIKEKTNVYNTNASKTYIILNHSLELLDSHPCYRQQLR